MSTAPTIRRVTRASGIEANVDRISSRMKQFASQLSPRKQVTFLAVSTEEGLENYIVSSARDNGMNDAAMAAAHAVGGKLAYAEELPDIATRTVGHLFYRQGGTRSSDTQSGSDPFALSSSLADMPIGSWVAITMRAPMKLPILMRHEDRQWSTWIHGRIKGSTHHSLQSGGTIAHVAVGSSDKHSVGRIASTVRNGMPGFDLETKVVTFPRPRIVALSLAAVTLSLAVAVVLGMLVVPGGAAIGGVIGSGGAIASTVLRIASWVMYGATLAGIAGTIAYVAWGKIYTRAFRAGRFPRPLLRWAILPPRVPTTDNDSGVRESMTGGGDDAGQYPLNRSSFKIGPMLPVGVLAPASGISSGSSETSDRDAPSKLVGPIGPVIGDDSKSRRVRLSARDLWAGIAVFGKPMSGKSYFLRSIFAWLLADQNPLPPAQAESPEQSESMLGPDGAIFAFESKDGEDAAEYQEWSDSLGAGRVNVVDLADPEGDRIDMYGTGTPSERAAKFVDKMVYHWDEQSIGAASKKTLRGVLQTAIGIPDSVFDEAVDNAGEDAPVPRPIPSPIATAYALLGGYGDPFGTHLANTISSYRRDVAAGEIDDDVDLEDIDEAVAGLSELYGRTENAVTKSERRNLQKAPVSKIEELMLAPHWWRRGGRSATFERLLRTHAKVVINSGSTSTRTGASRSGLRLPESTRDAISAMLLFSLRQSIEDICGGWQARGQYVAVISDEVARVAANSPDVIKWMRMQGRSYGVIPLFATQEPEQVDDEVRRVMFSLSSVISYAQSNAEVAKTIADDFTGGATEGFEVVRSKEIVDLPKYTVMVRTERDQSRQSVFTARVPAFESDRESFRDEVYPAAA